ncbi:PIN domain-containing protein [candidate division KSB1 bacterium]|nr:PIN domain-containing protein [candidate division KSB1 bacterium]
MIPRPSRYESVAADAMIWIYGYNRKSQYYSCSRKVRNLIAGSEVKGCITLQTATEIIAVVSNPRSYRLTENHIDFPSALNMVADVLKTPNLRLILPTASSLSTAIDLCRKYNLKRKQWYDAVLAATLLNNGVHVLYTMNDKDFLPIAELSLINPFTETLRPGSFPVEWGKQPSEIPPKTAGDTSVDDD